MPKNRERNYFFKKRKTNTYFKHYFLGHIFSFKFTLVLVYTHVIANTKKSSALQSSCTGIEYAWHIALNTLEYEEVLFPIKFLSNILRIYSILLNPLLFKFLKCYVYEYFP